MTDSVRAGGEERVSAAQEAMGLPKDYDEAVRQRDAWYDTARRYSNDATHYRSIVAGIGEMFGSAARIADDGSDTGEVLSRRVPALVRAALATTRSPAAVAVAVAEGWRLVPVEPTPEMIRAAYSRPSYPEDAWAPMLAAAPEPPARDVGATPAPQAETGEMERRLAQALRERDESYRRHAVTEREACDAATEIGKLRRENAALRASAPREVPEEVPQFRQLRDASRERQKVWGINGETLDASFRAVELAGEIGEVCNVVKKLERERRGWRGSRDTVEHLAEELADGIICIDLLAEGYGIDLWSAVVDKFNATSEKIGLPQRLTILAPAPASDEVR